MVVFIPLSTHMEATYNKKVLSKFEYRNRNRSRRYGNVKIARKRAKSNF